MTFMSALHDAMNSFNCCHNLKPKQVIALEQLYQGRDVFVNLPTGYGKSLVYQLGVFLLGHQKFLKKPVCLVVSPLNSLIEDQVSSLLKRGISACFLKDTFPERKEHFNFMYIHPEWVTGIGRKCLLNKYFADHICLIAVDEAHCIVQWGNQFRKSYGKLCVLSSIFPEVPILALTATAPLTYFNQIVSSLCLKHPVMVTTTPDRHNIKYSVDRRLPSCQGNDSIDNILMPLAKELEQKRQSFPHTLVYLPLKQCGYAFRLFLRILGNEGQYEPVGNVSPSNRLFGQFHSEYPSYMKSVLLDSLINNGTCRILFCTSAVGMGIDAPHVRHVIHIGVPRSIEEYFQETGRAGRDGRPSFASLYFNGTDIMSSRKDLQPAMRDLCLSSECVRTFLLKYFGFEGAKAKSELVAAHDCCSRCATSCKCESCLLEQAETEMSLMDISLSDVDPLDEATKMTNAVTSSVREIIRSKLLFYHEELQEGDALSFAHGLTLGTIDDIVSRLENISSVDDLLPPATKIWHVAQAHHIFDIISREFGWDMSE